MFFVTCYTFLKSYRALSKESAKVFKHLQKLGALFAKKAYKAKKCSTFFQNMTCYTLSDSP